jgi:hypothetical protein
MYAVLNTIYIGKRTDQLFGLARTTKFEKIHTQSDYYYHRGKSIRVHTLIMQWDHPEELTKLDRPLKLAKTVFRIKRYTILNSLNRTWFKLVDVVQTSF